MSLWMDLNIVAVVLTTVLLTALLAVYVGMLRQARTRFTWGLLLFALALWFQAAVQLYFFATMMSLYAGDVERLVLVQNCLALVGSAVLLGVTLRPIGGKAPSPAS